MPNANYVSGRAAEYAALRDLKRLGFSCIRAAASKGVYDIVGTRADLVVFIQCKRGLRPPSPAEYQSMVEMSVPDNALKIVLYYPDGVGAVRSTAARVLYHNLPLPDWCGYLRWLDGSPPVQPRLRLRS